MNEIEIGNVIKVTVNTVDSISNITCIVIQKAEDKLTLLELSSAKLMSNDGKHNILIKKSDNGLKFNSYVNVARPLSIDIEANNKITKYNLTIPTSDLNKIITNYNSLKNHQITLLTPVNEFEHMENLLMSQLENLKDNPQNLIDFLAFQSRFYQYSFRNTALIFAQNPYATFVASYTDWKNKFNASIKKGQTSKITVLRPQISMYFIKDNKIIDVNKATNEDKEKIANGEITVREDIKYYPVKLFDISQTTIDKSQYPAIFDMGYKNLESEEIYTITKEVCNELSIPVFEKDLNSIAIDGYFSTKHNHIVINELLEDTQKISALCHEFAHALLHNTNTQSTYIEEFEAESLSVMLCTRFNIPISNKSIDYVKQYYNTLLIKSADKSKEIISNSFERLKKQYKFISTQIQNKIINDYPHIYEKQIIKEKHKDNEITNSTEYTQNTIDIQTIDINSTKDNWSNIKRTNE